MNSMFNHFSYSLLNHPEKEEFEGVDNILSLSNNDELFSGTVNKDVSIGIGLNEVSPLSSSEYNYKLTSNTTTKSRFRPKNTSFNLNISNIESFEFGDEINFFLNDSNGHCDISEETNFILPTIVDFPSYCIESTSNDLQLSSINTPKYESCLALPSPPSSRTSSTSISPLKRKRNRTIIQNNNRKFKGGFLRDNLLKLYPDIKNHEHVDLRFTGLTWKMIEVKLNNKIRSSYNLPFRTTWKFIKTINKSVILLDFQESNLREVNEPDTIYFNILSRIVPVKSFRSIERSARNRDEMEKIILKEEVGIFERWCHFITSFEMNQLINFVLGNDYDLLANDDQLSLNKNIDSHKHHFSRLRSHNLVYISGKSCTGKLNKQQEMNWTQEQKNFSIGLYEQIMSYKDIKKPYKTKKSLAVMEAKYTMKNLQEFMNKYVYVDKSNVPLNGFDRILE